MSGKIGAAPQTNLPRKELSYSAGIGKPKAGKSNLNSSVEYHDIGTLILVDRQMSANLST